MTLLPGAVVDIHGGGVRLSVHAVELQRGRICEP